MNRLQRIAILAASALTVIFLIDYDSLALENKADYGYILRAGVWFLIAGITVFSYENVKTIFKYTPKNENF